MLKGLRELQEIGWIDEKLPKMVAVQATGCACGDGAFFSPEGAATLAGVAKLRASGWLDGCGEVLVLNTGSALKYPVVVTTNLPLLSIGDNIPTGS
ncbi:MAG: hypothetical protein ABI382_08115 [Nakamurella sp.]